MEILTLLKANIRKKKGAFIGIAVLMAIITTVTAAMISVRDNYDAGLETAFETADCGDTYIIIRDDKLTTELRGALESSALAERVAYYDALCTNGTSCGEIYDGNSWFLCEMRPGLRLFNSSLDGFESEIPPLSEGEIYLPLGLKAKLSCGVGDVVTVSMIFGVKEEFTVKGFVSEPAFGSMTIGWKQVFISLGDMERIYAECSLLQTENTTLKTTIVSVYQAADGGLSPIRFQRSLNLETRIVDVSLGALNRDQSVRYSTLLPDILINIILVFVIFLFVIVLTVMSHSIGAEIEIDYGTLGILKAQGFGSKKIRLLFFWQYILAQAAGIAVGGVLAIPIERALSAVCQSITGALPALGLSAAKTVLYMAAVLVCSAVIIVIKTHKIAEISPVRAIRGGGGAVYFDSRLNAPIAYKTLSASLALRQFTSDKRRYAGTVMIAAILTFFMITVNLLGVLLSSRKALGAMGMMTADFMFWPRTEKACAYMSDIEAIVESYSGIQEQNRVRDKYISLNGENLYCEIYEKPEYIPGILKGREPKYDNEILITKMVAETLELGMGDKVTVTDSGYEIECMVTGIYQSGRDSGMCFATNFEAAKRLGIRTDLSGAYFTVEDRSQIDAIIDAVSERYGEILYIDVYDEDSNPVEQQYGEIAKLLKAIINALSVLFAFVVIRMACSKAFIRERRDIGIYKAIGFTARKLRFAFAVRFLIVSAIGAALGTVFAILFSAKALGAALRLIGISKVVWEFTAAAVFLPMIAIGFCYFVFAYLASRKIRIVEVKELVLE